MLLGTSIVQTWSRHPVSLAQQAQVVASLAPGRFRLGVGPGHKEAMERTFGAEFRAPLGHLGEYVHILKELLHRGEVDFDGRYYAAHSSIAKAGDVPVMASAPAAPAPSICAARRPTAP